MSDTEQRPLILVAEDDESNFKLINAIIGKRCEILWARNGQDKGMAKAILMDIKMPEMTGVEATTIIREEDKEIPIIMQTAYAFNTDRELAIKAGATAVLVKPLVLTALRKCLSEHVPGLTW
jgi:CheY-like chemotaxis protein